MRPLRRLIERDKRDVYLRKAAGTLDSLRATTGDFVAEYTHLRAVIQPVDAKLAVMAYGLQSNNMRLMLYDGTVLLEQGDGVCVYVSVTDPPDYRVLGISPWDAQEITLEATR